ncbi:MAG: 4Fe-4S binding protein [Actinomycetia bacterium]|nr:4Fe-4S binding protein [Actinomycetes bacterium]
MSKPIVDPKECSGCGICVDVCPNGILDLDEDIAVVINEESCDGCGICVEECAMGAIVIEDE